MKFSVVKSKKQPEPMTFYDTLWAWARSAANSTAACGAVAAAAGWWVYDQLITHPLRCFYLKGPWWHNVPESYICAHMQGDKPEFSPSYYNSSDYLRSQCAIMIAREFESWEATVMTTLYFTVLTFGVLQLMCHCCIVRPIVNAIGRPQVRQAG